MFYSKKASELKVHVKQSYHDMEPNVQNTSVSRIFAFNDYNGASKFNQTFNNLALLQVKLKARCTSNNKCQ